MTPRDAMVDAMIAKDSSTADATTVVDAMTTEDASMANCTQTSAWVEPPFSAVQVSSLDVLCARFNCATSIEQAIARATQYCFEWALETGCGYTTVYAAWEVHHFETASNRLIGAGFGSDIFFNFEIEGCAAAYFQGGRAPDACAQRVSIDLCDDAGTDDAGS